MGRSGAPPRANMELAWMTLGTPGAVWTGAEARQETTSARPGGLGGPRRADGVGGLGCPCAGCFGSVRGHRGSGDWRSLPAPQPLRAPPTPTRSPAALLVYSGSRSARGWGRRWAWAAGARRGRVPGSGLRRRDSRPRGATGTRPPGTGRWRGRRGVARSSAASGTRP